MRQTRGFTLIELMIVVAIIAILAAIAIPQFNDYTARSQLSEAVTLLGGLKTPISHQYSENAVGASCTPPAASVLAGKYVTGIAPTGTDALCTLVATMAPNVSRKVQNATATMTYTPGTGQWACKTDAPAEVAPKACPHG